VRIITSLALVLLALGIALGLYGFTYHNPPDPGCDNYPAWATQQRSLDRPETALWLSATAMVFAFVTAMAGVLWRGFGEPEGGAGLLFMVLIVAASIPSVGFVSYLALTYRLSASSNCFGG